MDTELRESEREALTNPEAQKRLDAARERAAVYLDAKEIKQRLEARLQAFRKDGEQLIFQLCKPILQKHKDIIDMFSWQQFTPHWCDGAPCHFAYHSFVDDDYGVIYKKPWDEGVQEANPKKPWSDEKKATFNAAWKDLSKLDDELAKLADLLEVIFGDHVQVDVDIDGISTTPFKDHY